MVDTRQKQPIITVSGPEDCQWPISSSSSINHNNSSFDYKANSTSFNAIEQEESAIAMNHDGSAPPDEFSTTFVRSFHPKEGRSAFDSSPSKFSRLSLAIRRSLRLGTRRDFRSNFSHRKTLPQDKPAPTFTEFTDLRPEVFIEPQFGTLLSLRNFIQHSQFRQLKYFLRNNDWPVSHEIRKDLWRILVSYGDKEFDSSKVFYQEQIESLMKSKVQNFRPAFLSEPGIVVCDHGLKEIGVINLQRLLIVIEYARPEIRFVPILYPLCAVFLHYQPVDEAFACINRLLVQGNRFVLQSELAVYASRYTLLALLKKLKSKVYKKLRKRLGNDEPKLLEVMENWHFWIFKCLPFHYLVRLIDCFLFEGAKMLARAVLSVLYLWYKQEPAIAIVRPKTSHAALLATTKTTNELGGKQGPRGGTEESKAAELNAEICSVASKIPVTVQTFLDIGFSIRRFSNNSLFRQQRHYENKFRETVAKLRAEKNSRQPEERIYTQAFLSKIIDEDAARELMGALPARFQLETPIILFRLSEHGTSFVQFWSRVEEADQSILIIRSTSNHVFGAYLSSSWAERKDVRERAKTRYFGTGESFVWRLDEELKLPIIYTWSDQICDNYFMAANDKFMIIGSGGGDAIAIREEFVEGSSRPSQTFQSPELVPGGQFQINELEVWSIPSSR